MKFLILLFIAVLLTANPAYSDTTPPATPNSQTSTTSPTTTPDPEVEAQDNDPFAEGELINDDRKYLNQGL